MHTYIHTNIHICWFNFDALAQGNAYKPTKKPINYRGPGGDRTHDLHTEATPPAASCPARTLHATEIASKRNSNTHKHIFIRGFALAQAIFLLEIFAWICCDGFESQLRNGYLLKCDCLFYCNWHIGTIKWETKIDILGWRDRGSNSRPLVPRAGALFITLHLIQLIRWFHKNSI